MDIIDNIEHEYQELRQYVNGDLLRSVEAVYEMIDFDEASVRKAIGLFDVIRAVLVSPEAQLSVQSLIWHLETLLESLIEPKAVDSLQRLIAFQAVFSLFLLDWANKPDPNGLIEELQKLIIFLKGHHES